MTHPALRIIEVRGLITEVQLSQTFLEGEGKRRKASRQGSASQ